MRIHDPFDPSILGAYAPGMRHHLDELAHAQQSTDIEKKVIDTAQDLQRLDRQSRFTGLAAQWHDWQTAVIRPLLANPDTLRQQNSRLSARFSVNFQVGLHVASLPLNIDLYADRESDNLYDEAVKREADIESMSRRYDGRESPDQLEYERLSLDDRRGIADVGYIPRTHVKKVFGFKRSTLLVDLNEAQAAATKNRRSIAGKLAIRSVGTNILQADRAEVLVSSVIDDPALRFVSPYDSYAASGEMITSLVDELAPEERRKIAQGTTSSDDMVRAQLEKLAEKSLKAMNDRQALADRMLEIITGSDEFKKFVDAA